jgi:hypothetical protein
VRRRTFWPQLLGTDSTSDEIKLRAERNLGQLTREIERQQGARTDLTSSHDVTKSYRQQLAEKHIEPMQAHRWQQAAELPEEEFEKHVAQTRANGELLTSEGVRRRANDYKRKEQRRASESLNGDAIPLDSRWREIRNL